jgi:type IV secretory pathway TrbF-like protein
MITPEETRYEFTPEQIESIQQAVDNINAINADPETPNTNWFSAYQAVVDALDSAVIDDSRTN